MFTTDKKEMKHPHHDTHNGHKPCPRGHTEGVIRIPGGGKSYYYCDICFKEDKSKKVEEPREDIKLPIDETNKGVGNKKRPHIPSSKEPEKKS